MSTPSLAKQILGFLRVAGIGSVALTVALIVVVVLIAELGGSKAPRKQVVYAPAPPARVMDLEEAIDLFVDGQKFRIKRGYFIGHSPPELTRWAIYGASPRSTSLVSLMFSYEMPRGNYPDCRLYKEGNRNCSSYRRFDDASKYRVILAWAPVPKDKEDKSTTITYLKLLLEGLKVGRVHLESDEKNPVAKQSRVFKKIAPFKGPIRRYFFDDKDLVAGLTCSEMRGGVCWGRAWRRSKSIAISIAGPSEILRDWNDVIATADSLITDWKVEPSTHIDVPN